jgi:hypothetical protein
VVIVVVVEATLNMKFERAEKSPAGYFSEIELVTMNSGRMLNYEQVPSFWSTPLSSC